ncbi:MAG TPA: hypothetical protein VJ505_11625 [Holophagaceae bacterium]|nr:hypothetical protein [Holophagaceae bacterium]
MWKVLILAGLASAGPTVPPWPRPVAGSPDLQGVHQDIFRKFDVDYLRVAFYVDPVSLRHRPRGQSARSWLLQGTTWCGRRSEVLQDIGGARRAEGLKAQLEAHWPGGGLDPDRPAVKRLLASAAHPLETGDRIDYVWAPSGKVHIRMGDGPWIVLADRLLHQALLNIAFGNERDPATPTLDRALEALAPTRP